MSLINATWVNPWNPAVVYFYWWLKQRMGKSTLFINIGKKSVRPFLLSNIPSHVLFLVTLLPCCCLVKINCYQIANICLTNRDHNIVCSPLWTLVTISWLTMKRNTAVICAHPWKVSLLRKGQWTLCEISVLRVISDGFSIY